MKRNLQLAMIQKNLLGLLITLTVLVLNSPVSAQSLVQDSKGETSILLPNSQVDLNFASSKISGKYFVQNIEVGPLKFYPGAGIALTAISGKSIFFKDNEFQFNGNIDVFLPIQLTLGDEDIYFLYAWKANLKSVNLWDSTAFTINEKNYELYSHKIGLTYSPSFINAWLGLAYNFGRDDNVSGLTRATLYKTTLSSASTQLFIDPSNGLGPENLFRNNIRSKQLMLDFVYVKNRIGYALNLRRINIGSSSINPQTNLGLSILINKKKSAGPAFLGGILLELPDLGRANTQGKIINRSVISLIVGYPFN